MSLTCLVYSNRVTSEMVYWGQEPSQEWAYRPVYCSIPLKVGHRRHGLEWCKEYKNLSLTESCLLHG
ncbi:hypothetical protein TNCV_1392111 [Trichonephila clavipes]|nr:hypothetical protein TNCV_1392111 [Trichonephila clavipes]